MIYLHERPEVDLLCPFRERKQNHFTFFIGPKRFSSRPSIEILYSFSAYDMPINFIEHNIILILYLFFYGVFIFNLWPDLWICLLFFYFSRDGSLSEMKITYKFVYLFINQWRHSNNWKLETWPAIQNR